MPRLFQQTVAVGGPGGIGHTRTVDDDTYVIIEYVQRWYHPTALSADGLVTSVALPSGSGGANGTLVTTTLDVPRNITIVADAGQTSIATITGTDMWGATQTESITFNGTNTVQGNKAFKTVSQVHFAQRSGAANATVGWGDKLGLKRSALGLGGVGSVDNVLEAVAPIVSGVYDTVLFSTALNASKTYILIFKSDEIK
jgi:hypothetical protein